MRIYRGRYYSVGPISECGLDTHRPIDKYIWVVVVGGHSEFLFKGRGLTKFPTSAYEQAHDLTNISSSIFRDIDSGHGNNNCFYCRYIDQIGDDP